MENAPPSKLHRVLTTTTTTTTTTFFYVYIVLSYFATHYSNYRKQNINIARKHLGLVFRFFYCPATLFPTRSLRIDEDRSSSERLVPGQCEYDAILVKILSEQREFVCL